MGRAPARKAVVSLGQYCGAECSGMGSTWLQLGQMNVRPQRADLLRCTHRPAKVILAHSWLDPVLAQCPIHLRVVDADERQAGGPPAHRVQGALAHVQVGAAGDQCGVDTGLTITSSGPSSQHRPET